MAVLAKGTMVLPALAAARELEAEGIDATVVNCRFIKPLDEQTLRSVAERHTAILTVEEGTVVNGFGAAASRHLAERRWATNAILDIAGVPDVIIDHAARAEQLAQVGLDVPGLVARIRSLAASAGLAAIRETA